MKGGATESHCRDGGLHVWAKAGGPETETGWTRNVDSMEKRTICTRCFALRVEGVDGISRHPKPCYCYDGVFCKGEYRLSVKD